MNAILAYDLIVIEDEATPLASGALHANYYILTLCVMAVIAMVGMASSWMIKRQTYVERLKELNTLLGRESKVPFKIQSIKEDIALAETDLSASML